MDTKDPLKRFDKILDKSQDDFEKNIIYISSGALGISFAFIEKIVPLSTASNKCLLIWAWSLFGITLLISLLSHYIPSLCGNIIRDNFESSDKSEKDFEHLNNKTNRLNKLTDFLNITSIILLFLGIVFLIVFISKNIRNG